MDKSKRDGEEDSNTLQYGQYRTTREQEIASHVVTIDKLEHLSRYQVWRHAPYHYCLEVLLERYVLFLHYRGLRGDIMVESRNATLDGKLKNSFGHCIEAAHGTSLPKSYKRV